MADNKIQCPRFGGKLDHRFSTLEICLSLLQHQYIKSTKQYLYATFVSFSGFRFLRSASSSFIFALIANRLFLRLILIKGFQKYLRNAGGLLSHPGMEATKGAETRVSNYSFSLPMRDA